MLLRRKPLSATLLAIGLLMAAAGFLIATRHGPLSDRHSGMLTGAGLALIFTAAVRWFTPGDVHDCAPMPLTRRYYRELFPAMAAYVAAALLMKRVLPDIAAVWLRVVLALLPAVFIALAVRAMARYVRDSDELQRRIELESIALSAALVGTVYVALGFLQNANLIQIPGTQAMLWVFPALCILYGLIKLVVARRYL